MDDKISSQDSKQECLGWSCQCYPTDLWPSQKLKSLIWFLARTFSFTWKFTIVSIDKVRKDGCLGTSSFFSFFTLSLNSRIQENSFLFLWYRIINFYNLLYWCLHQCELHAGKNLFIPMIRLAAVHYWDRNRSTNSSRWAPLLLDLRLAFRKQISFLYVWLYSNLLRVQQTVIYLMSCLYRPLRKWWETTLWVIFIFRT